MPFKDSDQTGKHQGKHCASSLDTVGIPNNGVFGEVSQTKLKPDWVAFVFQLLCGWAWFCLCSVEGKQTQKPRLGDNAERREIFDGVSPSPL